MDSTTRHQQDGSRKRSVAHSLVLLSVCALLASCSGDKKSKPDDDGDFRSPARSEAVARKACSGNEAIDLCVQQIVSEKAPGLKITSCELLTVDESTDGTELIQALRNEALRTCGE